MTLTKHFTYDEMTKTDTGLPNPLTDEAKINLVYLCRKLEKVRLNFNQPIRINSAYRCPEVNKAVGGVSNSLHLRGRACDIDISSFNDSDRDLFMFLLESTSPTELIMYKSRNFIHYAI